MNPDEIIQMNSDYQIVFLRALKPFICKKFDYSEYRMSDKMEEIEIKKYKKKVEIETKKLIEDEKLPTFKEFIKKKKGGEKC